MVTPAEREKLNSILRLLEAAIQTYSDAHGIAAGIGHLDFPKLPFYDAQWTMRLVSAPVRSLSNSLLKLEREVDRIRRRLESAE